MSDDWLSLNRANWDERVPIHVNSEFYEVDRFIKGESLTLRKKEIEDLHPIENKEIVHLQCHFGLDSLSWARLGARVTGLDFSESAISEANRLASELNLDAEFITGNVYDAPEILGRQFDVVYTGIGALNWLPDIAAWASVISKLLKPGGELYLVEFHPFEWTLGEDDFTVKYDYFTADSGLVYTQSGSYADPEATTKHNSTFQWNHGLGEVVTALMNQGLELISLEEADESYIQRWPFLEKTKSGNYTTPKGTPNLPMMYTLRVRKKF